MNNLFFKKEMKELAHIKKVVGIFIGEDLSRLRSNVREL